MPKADQQPLPLGYSRVFPEEGSAESGVPLRLVVVVGAVVAVLRLMFSKRARKELDVAANQLEAALNEVDARLARMQAERSGHRVRLRRVLSLSPCDVLANRHGRSQAANDDRCLEGKQ